MQITYVCQPVPRGYLQLGELWFVLFIPVFLLENYLLNERPLLVLRKGSVFSLEFQSFPSLGAMG